MSVFVGVVGGSIERELDGDVYVDSASCLRSSTDREFFLMREYRDIFSCLTLSDLLLDNPCARTGFGLKGSSTVFINH